jgi:uncharacterized protein (DUF2141 family)
MTPEIWIALAGLAVTGAGAAIAYGVLRQNVTDLKEHSGKIESRVTACEAGHANTANEMNALRVDVAILTERSGATMSALDRIERHLSDREPTTTARRRTAPK